MIIGLLWEFLISMIVSIKAYDKGKEDGKKITKLLAEGEYMRKREMSYKDYGMTEDEVRYIKDFCQNADEEQRNTIKTALRELNPYVAHYVFYSLVDNLSYEDICAKNYLYIGKGDFYGHRRQGIAAIKRWMILYGIWEM